MKARISILAASLLCLAAPSIAQAEVDFAHDVVPILEKHCVECHGGEKSKGGFSMNTRRLFLDDETAVPGKGHESLFLELIVDTDPEYQMPPEKKPRVPAEHLAVLRQWVDEGMKWEPGFTFGEPTYEPPLKPRRPKLPAITDGRSNPVDRILDHYLAENKLPRPEPIDDLTFLRRIHLDLIGLPPTPEEVRIFVGESGADKRTAKVNDLLSRDLSYADHWLTFWNDLLRNDYSGTGFITKGRTQISSWLYDSLKTNKPFDQLTRELIAPPSSESAGFINGIKWRGTVSAGQTLPIQFSQSISQSFLGINMKCASCHDSFIDRWTLTEAYGLAAIYSEEPIELHRCDIPTGETAKAAWLFPEIGNIDPAQPKEKRLQQLADLMTHPENGRVTRTIVNRIWGQLMGRGIVHPFDAMQTEPWNADLLDFLASDFQENGYDLKKIIALITNSQAYQSKTERLEQQEETGTYVYGGPRPKRLTAEQFVDAIWQITDSAPSRFDAPIIRGIAPREEAEKLSHSSTWIWGPSAQNGAPAAGEKVLLRKDFTPAKPVRSAAVIATADNSFTLYLNAKPLTNGNDWTKLSSAPARNFLRQGVNRILLVATNGGQGPNLAGAYAALRLVYEDGTDETIITDETWQVSEKAPQNPNPAKWEIAKLKWSPVTLVSLSTWSESIDPQIGATLAAASANTSQMVRASLVKSDFLMRSLGRPNRDQIVTSRPSELTTLEAIDLSNSETLAGYLNSGAEKIAAQDWSSVDGLIDHLYLASLTRTPSSEERAILKEMFGEKPDPIEVADVLWAITMTPEFLLVR